MPPDSASDTSERFSNEVPAGRAIGTEPKEGTKLERDSVVTLRSRRGPTSSRSRRCSGCSRTTRRPRSRTPGSSPTSSTEDSDQPEGTVIAQDPGPGGAVQRGSEVDDHGVHGRRPGRTSQRDRRYAAGRQGVAAGAGAQGRGREAGRRPRLDDDGVVLEQVPAGGSRVAARDDGDDLGRSFSRSPTPGFPGEP